MFWHDMDYYVTKKGYTCKTQDWENLFNFNFLSFNNKIIKKGITMPGNSTLNTSRSILCQVGFDITAKEVSLTQFLDNFLVST